MIFKEGQSVRIKKTSKMYFGNYTGTEATVVTIKDGICEVVTFDGQKYMSSPDYLEPLLPPLPEIKPRCYHKRSYLNNPVNQFKFMYCPDCGKDWDV